MEYPTQYNAGITKHFSKIYSFADTVKQFKINVHNFLQPSVTSSVDADKPARRI